jgi:hypothetical protein
MQGGMGTALTPWAAVVQPPWGETWLHLQTPPLLVCGGTSGPVTQPLTVILEERTG